MANRRKWLVVLLGAALPVCAATSGSISGIVKSADGTPQMGALVEVFAMGTLQPIVAFTGQAGSFQVPSVTPGNYRLKVTAASFLPRPVENEAIRSAGAAVINLPLKIFPRALLSFLRPQFSVRSQVNW